MISVKNSSELLGLIWSLKTLIEGVLTQHIDADGCMFLLDTDGGIIAHPNISLNSRHWVRISNVKISFKTGMIH